MLELATIDNKSAISRANGLQQYFAEFERWLDVSKSSAKTYKAGVKALFFWQAQNGVMQPTSADIIAFKDALKNEGKTDSTIATYLAGVKAFFKWLEERGFYANIAARVKRPKISQEPKRDALTVKQLRQVISTAAGAGLQHLRNKAILTLVSSCGLRTIEVTRLTLEDLRIKNGQKVLYIHGKGDNKTFIPLPGIAARAIETYLALRGKTLKNAPLFASISTNGTAGKALSSRSISYICKQALIQAGFNSRRITAHSLRHSVATEALRYGASLHSVQLYLRHKKIETTLIYAHEIEQEQNECCSLLNRLLSA